MSQVFGCGRRPRYVISAIRGSKTFGLRPDFGPSRASGSNDELSRAEAALWPPWFHSSSKPPLRPRKRGFGHLHRLDARLHQVNAGLQGLDESLQRLDGSFHCLDVSLQCLGAGLQRLDASLH